MQQRLHFRTPLTAPRYTRACRRKLHLPAHVISTPTCIAAAAAIIVIARPVAIAVVSTFVLVWILAIAGTSDPSMVTFDARGASGDYVGMFSLGALQPLIADPDMDNCEFLEFRKTNSVTSIQ